MNDEIQLKSKTQCRYTPDAGEVPLTTDVLCGVCKEKMDERRDQCGPRSFAEAMGGSKSEFDLFTCPYIAENWHQQVIALRNEINKTSSCVLRGMLEQEVKIILDTRQPTVVKYWPSQ